MILRTDGGCRAAGDVCDISPAVIGISYHYISVGVNQADNVLLGVPDVMVDCSTGVHTGQVPVGIVEEVYRVIPGLLRHDPAAIILQHDNLTQADVTKMMDHINSYKRKKAERSQSLQNVQLSLRRRCIKASGMHFSCRRRHLLKPSLLKK